MIQTNCPELLANGVCDNASCPHRHNVLNCSLCNLVFESSDDHSAHLASKQHINRLQGESGAMLLCPVCEKYVFGMKNWAQHSASARHAVCAAGRGVDPNIQPELPEEVPGYTLCTTCNTHIPDRYWPRHHLGPKHRDRAQFMAFRTASDEAERDKNGITVSGGFDFGVVEGPAARSGLEIRPVIRNETPSSKIAVLDVTLASQKGSKTPSPFSISATAGSITYNATRSFIVKFRQDYNGRAEDRLEILFEDLQLRKRFIIARTLRVAVGNRADHEAMRPIAPYKPRKRSAAQPELNVVEGVAPPSLRAIPYVGSLPKAPIPAGLAGTLSFTGTTASIINNLRGQFLPHFLDSKTYARHFKHLLWIEEYRMERDLEHYDITEAKLAAHNGFHFLDVPGLAEKRPSVLVGDRILIQKQGATHGHWFEGRVHIVRKEEVGLRFHSSFRKASVTDRYTARFKLNRRPMRRQHLAMDTAFSEERILFPLPVHVPKTPYTRPASAQIKVFNPLIADNGPQLQAVVSILKRKPGSVPFVVFGPPGTGKTVTMVEAMRQVLVASPQARILACAPSNSAADLIASRLVGALSKDELFRLYAPSRHKEQVALEMREYTHMTPEGHFSVPPLARMKRFRVIITTCVSAAVVSGIGIGRGHYSHIFVDEAGQATEPEVMIAIKTMADSQTNVVLSGDPKQLGPIIRSAIARELGFETSYIERLMAREICDEKKGYGTSVVKLTKNFRSHNAILKFPNERFYKNELQQCGKPSVINSFLHSPLLPCKTFPIVFHAIAGRDAREASSPSFFNIDEASQVKAYVEALRSDRKFRITDADIGVIAPYHAQCQKIRNTLRAVAEGVKVGSVEEFQGQERRVIIISTVRSSREFVSYDLRHTLGFVANPRRFNVAVTRAQALLIIVGDPDVLGLDPLWRSFLNYIHNNGGWKGRAISWDPRAAVAEEGGYDRTVRDAAQRDMNEFTRRIEALTIAGAEAVQEGDGDDTNVDRPWNDME